MDVEDQTIKDHPEIEAQNLGTHQLIPKMQIILNVKLWKDSAI